VERESVKELQHFDTNPIKGRLRRISKDFPISIEAMTPRKYAGCSLEQKWPRRTPWMMRAAKSIAITALGGSPGQAEE